MSNLLLDISVLEGIREDKARKNLAEAERLMQQELKSLELILKKYYPLSVLERAANESVNTSSPAKILLPYLLQSILQTKAMRIETGFSSNTNIKESDWQKIRNFSEDFSRRLFKAIDMYSLICVKEGRLPLSLLDSYRNRLLSQILPQTMDEKEISAVKLIISSFSKYFAKDVEEIFGATGEQLCHDLFALIDKCGKTSKEMQERKLAHFIELQNEVERRIKNGDMRGEDAIMADILRHDPDYNRFDNTFDFYMVELDSNLSRKTLELFTMGLGDGDKPFHNGTFLSSLNPFIGIAGLHYCFVTPNLPYFIVKVLMRIIKEQRPSISISEVVEQLMRFAAEGLFRSHNSVYEHYEGKSISFNLIPLNLRNYFKKPEKFTVIADLISDEYASCKDTVINFLIDFEGIAPLSKVRENVYRFSLAYLLALTDDEMMKKEFFKEVFNDVDDEKIVVDETLSEIFDYDALREENEEEYTEEVIDVSSNYEFEYDEQDDDDKAESIDQQYEDVEELPEEYEQKELSEEERALLNYQYELPEEILEEQEEELEKDAEYEESFDYDQFELPEDEEMEEQSSHAIENEAAGQINYDELFEDDDEDDFYDNYDNDFYDEDEDEYIPSPLSLIDEDDTEDEDLDQLSLFDVDGKMSADIYKPASNVQEKKVEENTRPLPYLFMPGLKKKQPVETEEVPAIKVPEEPVALKEAHPVEEAIDEDETLYDEMAEEKEIDDTLEDETESEPIDYTEEDELYSEEEPVTYDEEVEEELHKEEVMDEDESIFDEMTEESEKEEAVVEDQPLEEENLPYDEPVKEVLPATEVVVEEEAPAEEMLVDEPVFDEATTDEEEEQPLEEELFEEPIVEETVEEEDLPYEEPVKEVLPATEAVVEEEEAPAEEIVETSFFDESEEELPYEEPVKEVLPATEPVVEDELPLEEEEEVPAEEMVEESFFEEPEEELPYEEPVKEVLPATEPVVEDELPLEEEEVPAEEMVQTSFFDEPEEELPFEEPVKEVLPATEPVIEEEEVPAKEVVEDSLFEEPEEELPSEEAVKEVLSATEPVVEEELPLEEEEEPLVEETVVKEPIAEEVAEEQPVEETLFEEPVVEEETPVVLAEPEVEEELPIVEEKPVEESLFVEPEVAEEDDGFKINIEDENESINVVGAVKLSEEEKIHLSFEEEEEEGESEAEAMGFEIKDIVEEDKVYPAIIKSLLEKEPKGPLKTFFEEESNDMLNGFGATVSTCLEQQMINNKDKIFSIKQYKLSVIVTSGKNIDSLRNSELLNNAGAVMYSQGEERWNVAVLMFDNHGTFINLQEIQIGKESFTDYDWRVVKALAENGKERK